MPAPAEARRSAVGWLLAALTLAGGGWGLARQLDLARTTPAIDYYQYWAVARVLRAAPRLDVYAPSAQAQIPRNVRDPDTASGARRQVEAYRTRIEVYSSPLLYALLGLPTGGDYDRDRVAFQYASLAAFMAGAWLMARALGYGRLASWALLALCLAAHRPLAIDAFVGNVNRLQFAGLAFVYVLLSRPRGRWYGWGAGATLGGLVLFKPNVVLALLLLALRRARRKHELRLVAWGAAAAGAAAVIVAWLQLGPPDIWLRWLAAVAALPDQSITTALGNYGLAQLLRESLGAPASLLTALAPLLALLAVWRRSTSAETGQPDVAGDLGALNLGLLGYLLSARLVWLHYFLLALPVVLVELRAPQRARRGLAALALATAAAGYLPLAGIARFDPWLLNFGLLALLAACLSGAWPGAGWVRRVSRGRQAGAVVAAWGASGPASCSWYWS